MTFRVVFVSCVVRCGCSCGVLRCGCGCGCGVVWSFVLSWSFLTVTIFMDPPGFTEAEADAKAAAEVYVDDGGQLLSVAPGANVLTLVVCEPSHLDFVRYVSAGAPSSRWDIQIEMTC